MAQKVLDLGEWKRKKRALWVKWCYMCQNENLRRFMEKRTLNMFTFKDGPKMEPLSLMSMYIRGALGVMNIELGYVTGEMKRDLINRKLYKVVFQGEKMKGQVEVSEPVKTKLHYFHTEREWTPGPKERAWLNYRLMEAGATKAARKGKRKKELATQYIKLTKTSKLKRPARPFWGPSDKANKWLWAEYQKLMKKFLTPKLQKSIDESNKKAKLALKIN